MTPPHTCTCHATSPRSCPVHGPGLAERERPPPTEGRKDDSGKARYDLIPAEALDALARLYGQGAAHYGDRNWENGLRYGRVFAALMRHAWAWWRGQRNCPIDGQHHMSSVAWCALALQTLEQTHAELDDRPAQPQAPDA